MAALPPGWEWDYDGSRWLYRYNPTGHVQYHFPKAGDEFPDYIDVSTPVPDLAPEERLESQQQVKRYGSTSGNKAAGRPAEKKNGWEGRMSATAQPVSSVWEGDLEDGEGDAVFQPESFMFLGPGAYMDVSPLIEEEEEAAKRTVVGIEEQVNGMGKHKGISPVVSANTTPMAPKSEVVVAGNHGRGATGYVGEAIIEAPPTLQREPIRQAEPVSQIEAPPIMGDSMIDYGYEMYELPVDAPPPMQQFDPVGIVAEMPTEYTPSARIETNPDPIEMADNSVLAPIETQVPCGIAELPEKNSPVENRPSMDETIQQRREWVQQQQRQRQEEMQQKRQEREQQQRKELEQQKRQEWEQQQRYEQANRPRQGVNQSQQHQPYQPPRQQSPANPIQSASVIVETPVNNMPPKPPMKITRKPTLNSVKSPAGSGATAAPGGYQPYVPGQSPPKNSQTPEYLTTRARGMSLQREVSLMMGVKPSFDTTAMPAALAPSHMQTPPPKPPKIMQDHQAPQGIGASGPTIPSPPARNDHQGQTQTQGLSYVPSVLKAGRNGAHRNSIHGLSPPSLTPDNPQEMIQRQEAQQPPKAPTKGFKYPSVLRPGAKPSPQSDQRESPSVSPKRGASPVSTPGSRRGSQGHGYEPIVHGQHHPSMAPAPLARPHTTAPDLPSTQHQQPQAQEQIAQPAAHEKVVQPLPYPVDPHEEPRAAPRRQSTAPYPCDDDPPIGRDAATRPLNVQQPARPASAMPILEHERHGPVDFPSPVSVNTTGPSSQAHQRRQSYQSGAPPQPFAQVPYPTSQPPRPQSAAIDASQYQGLMSANFATRPAQPPQIVAVQRRSTLTQDDVSPLRSRAESLSSVYPLASPSPIESRRGSANLPNNGSNFVPTPESQTPGSNRRGSTPLSTVSQPSSMDTPPMKNTSQGSKPLAQRTEESYFPPQTPPNHGPAPTDQGKDPRRYSLPTHQLANMMQQAPLGHGSGAPYPEDFGSVDQQSSNLQRSQSLRSSRPASGQPLDNQYIQQQGLQSPINPAPTPGHLLTRIEEHHDEYDAAPKPPVIQNKRHSLSGGPGRQPSPLSNRQSIQQPQGQAPISRPAQSQGPVPQQVHREQPTQPVPGQMSPGLQYPAHGQMSPPQQSFHQQPLQSAAGQMPPVQMGSQQIITRPPGQSLPDHQVRPLGPMSPQGPQVPPQGRPAPLQLHGPALPQHPMPPQGFQPLNQPIQKQPQWNPQVNTVAPETLRPSSVPPQQTPGSPGSKEKNKGWTKWFKGSKSNTQSPVMPSQQQYPPVNLPAPMPGPHQSSVYPTGDYRQPDPRQQGLPLANAPNQGFQPHVMKSPAVPESPWPEQTSQRISQASHGRPISDIPNSGNISPVSTDFKMQFPASSQDAKPQEPKIEQQPQNEDEEPTSPIKPKPENKFKNVSGVAGLPSQQQQPRRHPSPSGPHAVGVDGELMPAPLFSKSATPSRNSSVTGSSVPVRQTSIIMAIKQDKWAKKPAVDYSGDDWGDDFE
ncbi:hypothetical protein PT974_07141 [Cladobotryum mycophilum]|uniref:WW domain-containing protein n=1 Tax=Cladobotryum mycophilum TaxID=491253 RepID=A0ABR0SPM9_9HYPO